MFKPGSGRKKQHPAWNHFDYDDAMGASICSVDGCFAAIKGKNVTNILNHLRRKHKETADSLGSINTTHNSILASPTMSNQTIQKPKKRKFDHESRIGSKGDITLANFLISAMLPASYVENQDFKEMLEDFGVDYQLPGKKKMESVFLDLAENMSERIKADLDSATNVVLAIDWLPYKNNVSYLAISSAFFSRITETPVRVLLNMFWLKSSHSGHMIASKLRECVEHWKIDKKKILLITVDNVKNMIKDVNNVQDGEDDDDEDGNTFESNIDEDLDIPLDDCFKRLPSLAHTLQLVVKDICEIPEVYSIIQKARGIIKLVQFSSVLKQELKEKCGKMLIVDCPTKWNSTYKMITRMIQLREPLELVLWKNNENSINEIDWEVLKLVQETLEPFKSQNDVLETNSLSLAMIVPSILQIIVKLKKLPQHDIVARGISSTLDRFSQFLVITDFSFNPLPVASTLLDPTVSDFLQRNEIQNAVDTAKKYIKTTLFKASVEVVKKPTKLFKELREEMLQNVILPNSIDDEMEGEFETYTKFALKYEGEKGISFWVQNERAFPMLASYAQDLLSATASQAYVERIFSVIAHLTEGVGLHHVHGIEEKAFLKMNLRYYKQ